MPPQAVQNESIDLRIYLNFIEKEHSVVDLIHVLKKLKGVRNLEIGGKCTPAFYELLFSNLTGNPFIKSLTLIFHNTMEGGGFLELGKCLMNKDSGLRSLTLKHQNFNLKSAPLLEGIATSRIFESLRLFECEISNSFEIELSRIVANKSKDCNFKEIVLSQCSHIANTGYESRITKTDLYKELCFSPDSNLRTLHVYSMQHLPIHI